MNETDGIWVGNLIEALRQLQSYLVLGLGTSASAFALAVAGFAGPTSERVTVPGISVAVDHTTALILLIALCILAGALAYYNADSAYVAAGSIGEKRELLDAVRSFPSIGSSRFIGWRFMAVWAPFVLAVLAMVTEVARRKVGFTLPLLIPTILLFGGPAATWSHLRRRIGD